MKENMSGCFFSEHSVETFPYPGVLFIVLNFVALLQRHPQSNLKSSTEKFAPLGISFPGVRDPKFDHF